MKKTAIFKRIFSLLLISALCLAFAACGGLLQKYDPIISEVRSNVFEGTCSQGKITVVTGRRENPFSIDGKTEKKTDFTIITFTPDTFLPNQLYSFKTESDGVAYSGVMTMHPFGDTYSAEIETLVSASSLTLNIHKGEFDETVTIESVLKEGMIDAEKALSTALKTLDASLKNIKSSKGIEAEIYVRLIANPITAEGGYFWYVTFIGENTYAVLLDPYTAEVKGLKD